MKKIIKISSLATVAAMALMLATSCKKNQEFGSLNTGNFTDTTGTLKSLAAFPIGFAVEYPLSTTNAKYWATVKREGSAITFGNELKNSSVLKDDGTYNFTTADAFYNLATTAGLQVYGHTLVWHSQQNTNYYAKIVGGGSSSAPNLVANPGFETAGSGKLFANWSDLNHSNGTFSQATGVAANSGSSALQAVCVAGGNNYNTQILSDNWVTVPGKTYTISYYIKGAAAGSIQFEIRNSDGSVNYQGGKAVTTGWQQITYSYVAPGTTMAIAFDLGGNANTFYIDDVSCIDAAAAAPPSGPALVTAVDNAMKAHIQAVVGHYVGKIKQWDVINEPFTDAGDLRTNANTTAANGVFIWQNYLGAAYANNAFAYAHAADPAAELFMNDYNLEYSAAKLAAFVTMANNLKAANVGITGVGTQLHTNIGASKAGIDNMFKALAGTGLKVRISELDVRANTGENGAFVLDAYTAAYQADMYRYIIYSYFKYVPAAQRAGITIWGVDDASSWIITSLKKVDQPLLFDANFLKKPAYVGFKQGLQGVAPN
ncbi:MAG: endo-1,4-beta-xylanase [Bacteroidota bacterium]